MSGLDGNIKLGLDLDTKSAKNALSSFKSKLRDGFGSNDTKTLDQNIKTTEKNIKKLETQVQKTKDKLEDLNESEVKPKSVKEMEKELEKTEKQIAKLDSQFDKLASEQQQIVDSGIGLSNGKIWYSDENTARMKQLDAEIIKNGQDTEKLNTKANHLRNTLNAVSKNKGLSEEGRKYNRELQRQTDQIKQQQEELDRLRKKQGKTGHEAKLQLKGIKSVIKRIKGLVKRVLFFSIITKGLNSIKRKLIELIKTNTELKSSTDTIKGNLLTAFAPLWEVILPHLKSFLNILTQVSALIAQFMSNIFGVTLQHSKEVAKRLQDQVHGMKESKKEADKIAKSLTSFDTMNVFQDNKSEKSKSGNGGTKSPELKTNFEVDPKLQEKLKALLVLIGSIGSALALWKLTSLLTDIPKAMSKLQTFLGLAMVIAGAFLLIKGYMDAWVNGVDWKNFTMILSGLGLVVGGITLLVGPMAGAFVLVGGAISMVVLAVKDMIKNGPTLQNILLLIAGVVLVGVGVWWALSAAELGALWPIALIIAAIVAVVAVFVILWKKCDGFREFWINLWEKIKQGWHNFIDDFKQSIEDTKNFFANFKDKMIEFKDAFVEGVKNTIDNAKNKIEEFIQKCKDFGNTLKNNFVNTFNNISNSVERFINNIINGVNSLGSGLRNAINDGAEKIGLDVKLNPISPVHLPKLAQGAVIPANKEFMAILGDQKQGRNLEAPEELIRQIVREESGGHNFNIKATGSLAPLIRLLSLELEEENTRRTAF